MRVFLVLNFVFALAVYSFTAVGLPALILKKRLSRYSVSFRFLFYLVTGNLCIVSLVTLLVFLHICNSFTIILFTLAAAAAVYVKLNGTSFPSKVKKAYRAVYKLLKRRMGMRTLLLKVSRASGKRIRKLSRSLRGFIREKNVQLILLTAAMAVVLLRFGVHLLTDFGYFASDVIVHNEWINAIDEGRMYPNGVYPFAMHCVIYFIHAVSGMDVYIVLNVFWLVQLIFINLSIIAFLKLVCRNKYLPYIFSVIFSVEATGFIIEELYQRYYSSLPQEFGNIFIFPAVAFLLYSFRTDKPSRLCLTGFAISLSMTVSAHFYNTFVVVLLSIGMIICCSPELFKKEKLIGIMVSGVSGVVISLLPMIISLLLGNNIEGSLVWGTNVLLDNQQSAASIPMLDANANVFRVTDNAVVEYDTSLTGILKSVLKKTSTIYLDNKIITLVIMMAVLAVIVLGLQIFVLNDRYYGMSLITVGVCVLSLIVIINAEVMDIPSFMNDARTAEYIIIMVPILIIMLADAVPYIVSIYMPKTSFCIGAGTAVMNLLVTVLGYAYIFHNTDAGISSTYNSNYQTYGAVTCLTNIIRDNEDNTWTICSANDERIMAGDHGRHYELIGFLKEMEKKKHESIIIPTQYVYFFVEKRPVDHNYYGYEESGQYISEQGAEKPFPNGIQNVSYQLENRWILMSKMYYWAQEYMKLYPNEMTVYYETDNFVCYRIEQNTYSLYDFAIDYGYNTRRWSSEVK